MSKFENVLKAQKVKTTFFARFVVILLLLAPMLLSRGVFFSSSFFLLGERARSVRRVSLVSTHFFFYPDGERSDFAHHSLTLSLSLFSFQRHTHTKTHITVLPAATQTRALERHDGYDLFGRDSVGDDRECVWNARHGVEGFSDRVEQETGLLKEDRKRKRKRKPVVSLDYKYKTRTIYTTIKR